MKCTLRDQIGAAQTKSSHFKPNQSHNTAVTLYYITHILCICAELVQTDSMGAQEVGMCPAC